jgi:hypothetical protein
LNTVFLDINGVLDSTRSVAVKIGPDVMWIGDEDEDLMLSYLEAHTLRCIDPVCVALMNKLLSTDDTGVRLVLSSSHRLNFVDGSAPYGSQEHRRRLMQFLKLMGLKFNEVFFDITPNLHSPRGDEVQAWIDEHDEPPRYVIIDDGKDFWAAQPLVLCDAHHGFSFKNYADASLLLGGSASTIIV